MDTPIHNPHAPATSANAMIRFDHVTLAYRHNTVLDCIDGHIDTGSLTAVVGANGCGKSSLMKAIAGIIRPTHGHIQTACTRSEIAYLSQISEIDRSFPITVFDFAACGLWNQVGLFKAIGADLSAKIEKVLDAVGMSAQRNMLIGELSGGQFQRIRFAQLLLQQARLVLLDEPFTGIDERTTNELMQLIHHWHAQGTTFLVVLHDTQLVNEAFAQTMVLGEHRVLSWGKTAAALNAYTTAAAPTATVTKTSTQTDTKGPA